MVSHGVFSLPISWILLNWAWRGRQRSIDIKAVMIKNDTLIRTEGDISESENHEQHFVGF